MDVSAGEYGKLGKRDFSLLHFHMKKKETTATLDNLCSMIISDYLIIFDNIFILLFRLHTTYRKLG